MNSQVLKLNLNYQPIGVISLKTALIKLYQKIAEVVTIENGSYCTYNFNSWAEVSEYCYKFEKTDDDWIFTPNLSIVVPRVIRILTYDKYHRCSVKLTRRSLYFRDNNTCQYCGKKPSIEKLNIDHIIPKSQGGKSTWENLVCSCFKCNQKKGGKTPKEAGMKLIKEPVKPENSSFSIMRITNKKYDSWKNFISNSYWTREIEE